MLDRPAVTETDLVNLSLTVNGHEVSVATPPFASLAETLRDRLGLTATKIGCDAGDCGACTVTLGRVENGKMHYETVNSCLTFVSSLQGKQLISVEDLR